MKITVAMDSFKGSMSSLEAGEACARGIHAAMPEAAVDVRPLADGGEGTVEALVHGMHGKKETVEVTGPRGENVSCMYGILPDRDIAVIEMAGAAGLPLLPEDRRDPMHTTTYGVGEVIRDAIEKGCRSFIIGIGGSATNDGGAGMLQALGYGFLDEYGMQVPYGAEGLSRISSIHTDHVIPALRECKFRIACDVNNPLYGPNGCSAVFGPQKGADEKTVQIMDEAMRHYARETMKVIENADPDYPGSGAAGGLGFAFRTFLNGSLEEGVKIVQEETELEKHIKNADIVVTGEGRLDRQTVMGKAPSGAASLAAKYNIPVIALAGCLSDDVRICNEKGITAYFPIIRRIAGIDEIMKKENAEKNMELTAEQVFRLIRAMEDHGTGETAAEH